MGGNEISFKVTEAPEGGYDARALGHGVFTQGDDWDDLRDMVRDAVHCHFADHEVPGVIRLHFVYEMVEDDGLPRPVVKQTLFG